MSKKNIDKFVTDHMENSSSVFTKPVKPIAPGRRLVVKNIVAWVLIVILAGAAGYFYWQFREAKNNPPSASQAENEALIAKVGKIIDLPVGETPTVATVSDKDQLDDQDFFKNSANGDKILVYGSYRMVVLYRPSLNKIMKVAPLVLGENDNTNSNANTNSANSNSANTNS